MFALVALFLTAHPSLAADSQRSHLFYEVCSSPWMMIDVEDALERKAQAFCEPEARAKRESAYYHSTAFRAPKLCESVSADYTCESGRSE